MPAPAGRLDASLAVRTRMAASPVNREGSPVARSGRTRPVQGGATVRRDRSGGTRPARRRDGPLARRGHRRRGLERPRVSGVPGPAGRRWTGEDECGTGRGGVRARATPAAARGLAPGRAGPAPNGRGVSGALACPRGPIGWPGGANLNLATTMYARDHAERGAARAALLPTGEPFTRRPCRTGCMPRARERAGGFWSGMACGMACGVA